MFSANIYVMFIFSLSCRISVFLTEPVLGLTSTLIQTGSFAITMPFFIRIIKKELRFILKSLEQQLINYILLISLSSFIVIFLINYILVEGRSSIVEILLLAFVITGAILSYRLAYQLVLMHKEANALSRITRIDSMTKLKNRKGLYEDVVALVENEVPFSIIYIDLDHFKKVNDSYGHATGDAYLLEFVNAVRKVLRNEEHFYRLHGDEFVIISEGPETETLCNTIENLRFQDPSDHMEFRGASTGCALFPKDGDTLNDLLYMADFNMYTNKKERHTSIAR
jgi:diguanylate cyclase (GGDEF)-like protein